MGKRGEERNKKRLWYSEKSENIIEGIYKNTKQGLRSTGPKVSGIIMSEYVHAIG